MSVEVATKTIRLTIYVPGVGKKKGSWPNLDVKLSPALMACATYSSFIDDLLSLLKKEMKEYPSWLDEGKGDGSLFLFSENPCDGKRNPCDVKRQPADGKAKKKKKDKWTGNYWGGKDGTYGRKDIEALKKYLHNPQSADGNDKPHLYITKACPLCIEPGSKTLKILTARFYKPGVCDLTKGNHTGSLSLPPSFLHTRVLLYCQSRANRAVTVPSVKPCVRAPFCNHRNSILLIHQIMFDCCIVCQLQVEAGVQAGVGAGAEAEEAEVGVWMQVGLLAQVSAFFQSS